MDIDKGCSLCCRLEAVNTFEALWGFSLEPRQQFVLSSRYNQINYIKCKHFILWSGPECVHERSLQRHNSCKPQPRIKKKNPEEIVLPCLDNINFMWFFYIEKRKRFLVQFTGHWTPDPRPQTGQSLTDLEEGTKIYFFHFQDSVVQVSADAMSWERPYYFLPIWENANVK